MENNHYGKDGAAGTGGSARRIGLARSVENSPEKMGSDSARIYSQEWSGTESIWGSAASRPRLRITHGGTKCPPNLAC